MSLLRRIESARPAADVTGAAMPPLPVAPDGGGGMDDGNDSHKGPAPTRA